MMVFGIFVLGIFVGAAVVIFLDSWSGLHSESRREKIRHRYVLSLEDRIKIFESFSRVYPRIYVEDQAGKTTRI